MHTQKAPKNRLCNHMIISTLRKCHILLENMPYSAPQYAIFWSTIWHFLKKDMEHGQKRGGICLLRGWNYCIKDA